MRCLFYTKQMIQEIEITGKNINDLWNLECVHSMIKTGDGFVLELNHQVTNGWVARKGESLRRNDNGKWEIVRKGK